MTPILDLEFTICGEREKSKLQSELEAEGWKWETNVSIEDFYTVKSQKLLRCGDRLLEFSTPDERIKYFYQEINGFDQVRVEKAFDCKGRELKDSRAVYVKLR